jgi:hypothetical protein
MLGDWSDPVPMLLCYLHLLKHPRSLVRPPRTAKDVTAAGAADRAARHFGIADLITRLRGEIGRPELFVQCNRSCSASGEQHVAKWKQRLDEHATKPFALYRAPGAKCTFPQDNRRRPEMKQLAPDHADPFPPSTGHEMKSEPANPTSLGLPNYIL